MPFDALAFWRREGRTYKRDFQRSPAFEMQEQQLLALLRELDFDSVLEIGCGFGRITQLVRPFASEYTAIDVSPDQIEAARQLVPDVEYVCTPIEEFEPGRKYDLVLAVEVLMHVPPEYIGDVVDKIVGLSSRHVVNVDWYPLSGPRSGAEHNWVHDYPALYGVGMTPVQGVPQVIFHKRVGK